VAKSKRKAIPDSMAMGDRFTFADWRRTIEELRGE
jgi:hypothetical protein